MQIYKLLLSYLERGVGKNINGKWNAKIVNKILKNWIYIGELIQEKKMLLKFLM